MLACDFYPTFLLSKSRCMLACGQRTHGFLKYLLFRISAYVGVTME